MTIKTKSLAFLAAFTVLLLVVFPVRAQTPASPPQPGLLTFWSSGVSHATKLGEVDWSKYTSVTVETAVNWPVTNSAFYEGGPTDYFAARMVGKIEIPETGTWTFGLSSDAGARLFIDGQLVVNDDANHSFRRTAGQRVLQAGSYSIEIRYLEVNYSQGLVLDWAGPGVSPAVTIPASAFGHEPAAAEAGSQNNGLRAYWSSGVSHATKLGEVDWTQYDSITVEPSVSWSITNSAFYTGGPTDYFALKLKGTITIAEAGEWQFKLGSDAGARLFIDGNLVVNDDANHSFRFTSGNVTLTAGTHDFEIRYLEVNYSQGLIATWKSPSATYEEVIPSWAFTPATVEPPGQQDGNGLNAYWSNSVSHATRLGQVDWTRYDTATTVSNVSWRITNNAFYANGPTDYFAVALIGELTVPASGLWTFKLGSDAGALLLIDGLPVINDDANHSFRFTAGTVNLAAGVHRFEVRYLEVNYSQGLFVTWQAPGGSLEEVIPASAFAPAAAIAGASGLGLRAYWSSGVSHATKLGEVDWSTFDTTTVESRISWPITNNAFYTGGPTDYFAVRLAGLLRVPASGSWTFSLGSDAGARLFVNGQLVVNDDANHSFRFTSGNITLPSGDVRIEVRYLEVNYSQGLVLTWNGPGVASEEVIPPSAFSPDPDEPPADAGGGGLRAYWSSGVSHATKLGEVDWISYDTTSVVPKVNWRITNNAFYNGGPTDYFALRLKGTINIPEGGSWQFKLGSDAGARLLIDGIIVVNDDANHSFRFTAGAIALTAGSHEIEIRYMEVNYSQGLFVTWRGPSDPYETVIPSSALTAAALESPGGSAAGSGGLAASWSTGNRATLDAVNWASSTHTSRVDNINWRITNNAFYNGGPTDYFAVSLKGTIVIPESGNWNFRLGSDAGARLIIDGQTVINDDANHSFRFTGGSVSLSAGRHSIEVQYLELNYSQGLVLTWTAPSSLFEAVVPAAAFDTPKTKIIRWQEVGTTEESQAFGEVEDPE